LRTAIRVFILFALVLLAWPAMAAKVTVDDLMRLRSLSHVRISPDGKRVAYVVSTPSFEKAAHEAVLYVVPSSGGTPVQLTHGTRIFNKPLPAPGLRWSPDGSLLSFVGFVNDTPQVMAISPEGGEAYPLTSVEGGVTTYEWSLDGTRIAFQGPDPVPAEEQQRKKDKTYVIEVDRNERPPRLWVVDVPDGTPKALSPPDQWVVDFSWAPDGEQILYSSSRRFGFYAQYNTPRQVSLQSDLAVIQFGLSGIHIAGFERALAHHFALRIAATQAIRRFLASSTPSPTHIILNEASQVLVDEYMVSTVVKMLSTLPAFGVTLHLAFQDAHALAKADRFGQSGGNGAQSVNTLLGVLGTHWLFFQAPASAHEIGERLELSREEVGSLSWLKVGEAVLVLPDQQHLPLRVVVPPPWMPAFETDMTSMKRNLTDVMETATIRERGG